MITWFISVLPLFVCRFLGIPVPYARLFPEGSLNQIEGQTLLGDIAMPATSIEGAGADRNLVRNARLATTTWKTWTLLRAEDPYLSPIRVMYGADQVIITKLRAGVVAVRNGAEACRLAIIDGEGREVRFKVIYCGPRESLEKGVRRWLREEGHRVDLGEPVLGLINFV